MPRTVDDVEEFLSRYRSRLIALHGELENLATVAKIMFQPLEINDAVDEYRIEWANADLILGLMIDAELPIASVSRMIDAAGCGLFGPDKIASDMRRMIILYGHGVKVHALPFDIDAAEAELAKKSA